MRTARKMKAIFKLLVGSEHFRKVILPLHLFFGLGVFFLVNEGGSVYLLFLPLFWILFSGMGIAVGYHRLLAHRAFTASVFVRRLTATLGAYAGQSSPIFWVSVHRGLHHPFSDQPADPHTPQKGWWHAYFGWQLEASGKSVNMRHAVDLVRDPYLRALSEHYFKFFWAGPLLVAALDWRLALFAVVPAMVMANHQENIVNTLCHQRPLGYRNFDVEDNSVNIWILGILCWGQGFHNNHHRLPRAANFGVKPWEFDPTRPLVWLLAARESAPHTRETPPLRAARLSE